MSTSKRSLPPISRPSRLLKLAGIASMVAAASLLSACGTMRPDRQTTSSIPDDYRTRHPITVAEVEHSLDVPIGTDEHGLTAATRDLIKGFAQDYLAMSKSTIRVAIPMNTANAAAASAARNQVRRVLTDAGVPSTRVVLTSYNSPASDVSAPVRLSFVAVTAITDECGQWPSDLVTGPSVVQNRNYENFGCASQQNLAAQISNPTDLVGPRGMSPIDAANRATVIQTYRDDGNTPDASSSTTQ
jgi:pilus assembly protein CpaD